MSTNIQPKETEMKNIVVASAFFLGFSGAAFADMNNKPADYINSSKAVGTTHAFAAVMTASTSRCDEAAGGERALAACYLGRFATPGGGNSGGSN
jgi:hypothetical protein